MVGFFLLCEYYFLCYCVYSIVSTPYSAEDCATHNPDQQNHKYNGKEFDTTHGLNTYDYGARQYNSLVGRWDRIDPLCEKYYSVSPYAYCANNPVSFVDPNGMEIWISYYDDNDELQKFKYNIGMTCEVNNVHAQNIVSNLNAMAQNEDGKSVVESLVNSSSQYGYMQVNTRNSDNAEGYWDPKTSTVCLQDPSNTLTFAEETFHVYQRENERGGSYAVNEVEAKLFSAKMNLEIDGWNTLRALEKITGSEESGHESYGQAMFSLLFSGYNHENFKIAANRFLLDTLEGSFYSKHGYSVGKIYSEPLIKRFLPVK